jgi:hypothetical protein
MATNYYKENIERITEQALEQEVLNDFDKLKYDAIDYIQQRHSEASEEIIAAGKETEKTIWDSIKKEISNKGYRIVISDDRNGNVTVAMIKG